ncbi:MAG: hypothetical protein V3U59_03580 [Gammaproteobacteria bacterium]
MRFGIWTVLLLCAGCVAAPENTASNGTTEATSDEAEIVRIALDYAVRDKAIPDHYLLEKQGLPYPLSTENIRATWINADRRFQLMSPDQIQTRAQQTGDFLFLRIKQVNVAESTARVSLENIWAAQSDNVYISGGGFEMQLVKEDDVWVVVTLVKWQS